MMTNKLMAAPLAAAFFLIAACGGGSSRPPVQPPPPPPPPPPPSMVAISGTVSFQSVPLNPATSGLNYSATTNRPARGVVVEARDGGGALLGSSVTTNAGGYSISVPSNTQMRIEAKAQMLQSSGASWNITARDNVNGNALYVLAGGLASSGAANSTRDLLAPSGWGGASYTSTRAAAPFAILDTIYSAVTQISAISPSISLPALQVFWSTQNRATDGDITLGEIGSTSFTRVGGLPTILVQGDANNDTDEYDGHVIAHEFGHYIQDALSRDDSIGGAHSTTDRLDPRVAFSEGFGNAYSAFVRGDPVYRDSSGPQQASGFSFNVESNTPAQRGWFNESSAHSIINDIIDAPADGVDVIAAGFGPVLSTLSAPAFVNGTSATTIYSFTDALRSAAGINGADLDALMNGQLITGRTPFGTGETNNGAIATALPVYQTLVVGAPAINICSVDDAGTGNKLGNRVFMRMTLAAPQTVQLAMTRTSGPAGRDPDFFVYLRGAIVGVGGSAAVDSETITLPLGAGEYVIVAYDFLNTDDTGPSGDVCFDFSAL